MRLIDRLMELGCEPDCEVFVVDNVAKYWFEVSDGDYNFPNIAPPFKTWFMEYRRPQFVLEQGKVLPSDAIAHIEGAKFWAKTIEGGWEYFIRMFNCDRAGVVRKNWECRVYVNADGSFAEIERDGAKQKACYITNPIDPDPRRQMEDAHDAACITAPYFLALSLMHCKNVTLQKHEHPPKLAKRFIERHGRPMVEYKVLDIKPMTRVLNECAPAGTSLKQRLHICRGHFKNYEGKGLFGKYKGMYWWDSHVRGDVKEGAIVKDYRVGAPK